MIGMTDESGLNFNDCYFDTEKLDISFYSENGDEAERFLNFLERQSECSLDYYFYPGWRVETPLNIQYANIAISNNNDDHIPLKISYGDQVVAHLQVGIWSKGYWSERCYPQLEDKTFLAIIVDEAYHRLGIGEKSISLVMEIIRPDLEQVYAVVNVDNIPSQKLFNKLGFSNIGEVALEENDFNYIYELNCS